MSSTAGFTASSSGGVPADIDAYRRLALRVIDRAWRDAGDPSGAPGDRSTARAFLAGSRMLFLWCEVAALDPYGMMNRAGQLGPSGLRQASRRRPLTP